MPTLAAPLDFAKLEARNIRGHLLAAAPSSPVTGQLYYNTADNTLYWWDGSAWVSARGGASATPPATGAALGTVQLAGDLAGTATSPQIAAGAVTDAEVAAANKDGVAGTPSLRTLGYGSSTKAMPGNGDIGWQSTQNAVMTDLQLNGHKITTMADPSNPQDAATKAYVDSVAQGLDVKASVKCATTTNITLSGTSATPDNIVIAPGDRVLVKAQTDQKQNGIYVCSAGAWSRATDMDVTAEFPSAFVFVDEGTLYMDTGWVCMADASTFVLGTNNILWTQFAGAGEYIGGGGLTLTGKQFDVGAGAGIQVNADSVQVANNGITNAMIADGAVDISAADVIGVLPQSRGGFGTDVSTIGGAGTGRINVAAAGYFSSATHGAGTTITIPQGTHFLRNLRGLIVQVQDEATGNVELPDISVSGIGTVTITFGASVTANSKRVTIIG